MQSIPMTACVAGAGGLLLFVEGTRLYSDLNRKVDFSDSWWKGYHVHHRSARDDDRIADPPSPVWLSTCSYLPFIESRQVRYEAGSGQKQRLGGYKVIPTILMG
jgi:hypothetical protein